MLVGKKEIKRSTLALAIIMASSSLSAAEVEAEVEVIEVKGIRGSMVKAVYVKRGAEGVVDAISSEDIGKLPDQNLAESLQRISGVSIDRSGGEGQQVTVRGFGPQFNTVLVNGRQLATDSTGREFNFDLIAAELVNGVDIYKTSTSSLPSGGIGSTINIRTAKPLSFSGFKAIASAKGLYNGNSEELTPQFSGLLSNTFADDSFGALFSFSHQQSKGRSDEAQVDGWLPNAISNESIINRNGSENTFLPQNYDQRVVFDERTRTGGSLVLQYNPNDEIEVTADVIFSEFDVKTNSQAIGHWFNPGVIENAELDPNGTVIKFDEEFDQATDFHARTFDRQSKMHAFSLSAEWQVNDNFSLNFDASDSQSKLIDPNGDAIEMSNAGYWNRISWDHSKGNTLPGISGFEDAGTITKGAGEGRTVTNYLNPSNILPNYMSRSGTNVVSKVSQIKLDGKNELEYDLLNTISFGLLSSSQEKNNQFLNNDSVVCQFCYHESLDIPDEFFSVFDAGSDFLGDLSGSNDIPNQWLQHNGDNMFAYLEQQARIGGDGWDAVPNFSYSAKGQASSFTVTEDILAAYVDLKLSGELGEVLWDANIGVRYEQTDVKVTGLQSTLVSLYFRDPTDFGREFSGEQELNANSSYSNLLPNVNISFDLTDDIISRISYSKTITRPTLLQMAPAVTINTTRPSGVLTSSSGNAELKPFESDNLDLSLEWYYEEASYLSVGYFRKDVENFIVTSTQQVTYPGVTDPSTGTDETASDVDDEIAQFTLTLPDNGETAKVDGFELAAQHTFGDSGFGIITNLTIVNSNAELDTNNLNQTFALTGLSDSKNLVLFYEDDAFQIRLAWNQRDGFLQSTVQGASGEPTFVKSYQQFDLSGSYEINDHFTAFFEGTNLTGEETIKHGRYENHFLLAQDTGPRYALGLRATF